MIITKIVSRKKVGEYLHTLKEDGIEEASKYEVMDPNEESIILQFKTEKDKTVKILGVRDIGRLVSLLFV